MCQRSSVLVHLNRMEMSTPLLHTAIIHCCFLFLSLCPSHSFHPILYSASNVLTFSACINRHFQVFGGYSSNAIPKLYYFVRCHLFDFVVVAILYVSIWRKMRIFIHIEASSYHQLHTVLNTGNIANEQNIMPMPIALCPKCMQAISTRINISTGHCIQKLALNSTREEKKRNAKCHKFHCYFGGWNWRRISFLRLWPSPYYFPFHSIP